MYYSKSEITAQPARLTEYQKHSLYYQAGATNESSAKKQQHLKENEESESIPSRSKTLPRPILTKVKPELVKESSFYTQIPTPRMDINPLLEAETMLDQDDPEFVDYDQESQLEEEEIPCISIRALADDNITSPRNDEFLIKIRVRPECLTRESLRRSILQVVRTATNCVSSKYHTLNGDVAIEGLFRETDNLFIPLDDILHSPSDHNETVFRLSPSFHKKPKPRENGWKNEYSIFGFSAVLAIYLLSLPFCLECIWSYILMFWKVIIFLPVMIDKAFVDWPLRKLYRYGPAFFGWEGESLPSICARITHFGDQMFWKENMDECIRTYANKVTESMYIRKPLIYVFFSSAIFYVLRNASMNKHKKEMEESNEVAKMIARIIKKAMDNM